MNDHSHKRLNILTGEWVLVSPHRNKRPWQGKQDEIQMKGSSSYDENCYLCPTNKRANKEVNPDYKETFVFTNDFAALESNLEQKTDTNGLLQARSETGICRVVCFSPDHSKSLAEMSVSEIRNVVDTWKGEYSELSKLDHIAYVQVFENKGAIMGCSNPHPHGQIWATSSITNEVQKKEKNQKEHFTQSKQSLLSEYLNQELELKERILFENDHFVVLVPFWAVWPFETMILPRAHQQSIDQMSEEQSLAFSESIQRITSAYDKLFNCSFPYSSGIHQAPVDGRSVEHWHWHMSFYPPLLRSASVKKFMVGFEMFGMPQRDITAEHAAKRLRELISEDLK